MIYQPESKRVLEESLQRRYVEQYGEAVWEDICSLSADYWRLKDAVHAAAVLEIFSPRVRTDIVKSVLRNVEAEWKAKGAQPAYERLGKQAYRWLPIERD